MIALLLALASVASAKRPNKEKMKLAIIVLTFGACLWAQNDAPYGFQPGTVVGAVAFGSVRQTGGPLQPAGNLALEVGVRKYLAIFGDGEWANMSGQINQCDPHFYPCIYTGYALPKVHYYQVGGGFQVVGTNHSRFVPYGKLGIAYVGGTASWYYSQLVNGRSSDISGAAAVLGAGGVRGYVNHHFGIDVRLTALRTLNNYNSTIVAPTVGVFFQSK